MRCACPKVPQLAVAVGGNRRRIVMCAECVRPGRLEISQNSHLGDWRDCDNTAPRGTRGSTMNIEEESLVLDPKLIPDAILRAGVLEYRKDHPSLDYYVFDVPVDFRAGGALFTGKADGSLLEIPYVSWVRALPHAVAQCQYEGKSEILLDFLEDGGVIRLVLDGESVQVSRSESEFSASARVPLELFRSRAIELSESVRAQVIEALPELKDDEWVSNWIRYGSDLWFKHGPTVFGWKKKR